MALAGFPFNKGPGNQASMAYWRGVESAGVEDSEELEPAVWVDGVPYQILTYTPLPPLGAHIWSLGIREAFEYIYPSNK